MPLRYFLILSVLLLARCSKQPEYESFNPIDYVDAFIGTANNGNVNPGATTPWGMVTMTPHTIERGLFVSANNPRPYEHGNEYLYGFSHTAISGVGCHESGSIVIAPVFGDIRWKPQDRKYHYSMETASPGYYKVKLDEDLIFAEMTATPRSGLSRFSFQDGWAHIILDLSFGITHYRDGMVRITAPNEIVGYKYEGLFCGYNDRRKVYFVAQFDRTAMGGGVFKGDTLFPDTVTEIEGEQVGAVFSFRTLDGSAIQVKTGLSYVSIENARENLHAEQPNFSFSLIRQKAREAWEKELSKIMVHGGTENHKKMFYTALYRSLLNPHIFQDVNGEYPLMHGGGVVGTVDDMNRHSVYSLWDTYRTLHPLLATFFPAKQIDMVHSMIGMYLENGWLPKWEIHADESGVMVGDPAVTVIADTYMKGLHKFDIEKGYKAIRHQATHLKDGINPLRPALKQYDEFGYIPHEYDQGHYVPSHHRSGDKAWGSVSVTLEYALADWTIAQMANALGKNDDYDFFMKRSQYYKNLFDAESGFFRSRLINGDWLQDFDPLAGLRLPGELPTEGIGYCEGSAWNYAFFVPHDIPGLITLLGQDQFITRLQTLFANNYFDMGNEPDIAFPFLFNYVEGEEWRTQKTVREVIAEHFGVGPNGLPGNDDLGTMSAWLVWAMMGLYQDCPASNQYQISTPYFDKVEIDLDQEYYPGDTFVIETKNLSDHNIFIKSKKLNGNKFEPFVLTHHDVVNGGTLQISAIDKK